MRLLENDRYMNDFQLSEDSLAPIEPDQPRKRVSVRKIEEALARHRAELELLVAMASIIDLVPDEIADRCSVYCDTLDFNSLSREQTRTMLSCLHAGKWEKSVNASMPDLIDYTGEVDGVKVRLWAAAPPESCRVVEFEEVIPATIIKRRKLICEPAQPQKETP